MKRIMAALFVVALAFTMISGCACTPKQEDVQAMVREPLDKCAQYEQACEAAARRAEAAAQKAEAAARRAEAAADKAESIFMKHMKK